MSWLKSAHILFALCLLMGLLALAAGSSGWRWTAVAELVRGDDIVAGLRAPRVVLAALVGASLALAGVVMQTLLRNDLADPYILGLSGGASAGAVSSLALWPGFPPGPAAAIGAAGAAATVRALTRGSYHPTRLLLAGVTVGSLLASATGLVLVLAPRATMLRSATFWLFGGLGTPQWNVLAVPAIALASAIGWTLVRAERLDRLTLGDDVAASLGVDIRPLRRTALLIGVVLTAAAVAVGGLIGFIGLLGPHIARRLVGATHRRLVPVAVLVGALVVMAADTAARTAFAPREIPVGLVTALFGGPFFLVLLNRRNW
ncbi:MAG: iron ABC transporter permease [Proteobacteria bacterium]|nr:iron ABC transporter permease [Pseudomonadota bacterium]